jgi:hypothetical protein
MPEEKPTKRRAILLAILLFIIAIIAAMHFRTKWMLGAEVKIGRDSVFYLGEAGKGDAEKLGAFLKETGWFRGQRYAVQILKTDRETVVSLLVSDEHKNDPRALNYAQKALPHLAEIFGTPVRVRICNRWMTVLHEIPRKPSA